MTQLAEMWDGLTSLTRRVKALETASIDAAKLTELTRTVAALTAWRADVERDAARAQSKYRATSRLMDPSVSEALRDAGID